jgi:hypothetical protein
MVCNTDSRLDVLRADAWYAHALPELLLNIQSNLLNVQYNLHDVTNMQSKVKCVFPECGSGFSEWHVVQLLQEVVGCRKLSEVVMMDGYIQERWLDVWDTMAARTGVKLVVLSSYVQLQEWADMQEEYITTLVFYINGSFRFSQSTCPCDPEQSKAAAILFWRWCHAHVLNTPTNFLVGCPTPPCACTSWLELADCHDYNLGLLVFTSSGRRPCRRVP